MIVLWIILGLAAYLLIGGTIAGFVHDEELANGLVFCWPLIVAMWIAITTFELIKKIGIFLTDKLAYFIRGSE